MSSGREVFHFDLDEERLKTIYLSESPTGFRMLDGSTTHEPSAKDE